MIKKKERCLKKRIGLCVAAARRALCDEDARSTRAAAAE